MMTVHYQGKNIRLKFEFSSFIFRHEEDIDNIFNEEEKVDLDYFDCSNLLNGVLLPGLRSSFSEDNQSI